MIANMIADHDEAFGSPNVGPYKPTVASRILECERELSAKWDTDNVTVELGMYQVIINMKVVILLLWTK